MEKLVGKIVSKVFIGEGEHCMAFVTDQGTIAFHVEGDCCSESWFADLVGFRALIGSKIVKHVEIPLESYNLEDGRGRQEYDDVYGHRLVTELGSADIIFRNSSNGYYGGWIDDGSFLDSTAAMREITEDWMA